MLRLVGREPSTIVLPGAPAQRDSSNPVRQDPWIFDLSLRAERRLVDMVCMETKVLHFRCRILGQRQLVHNFELRVCKFTTKGAMKT